MISRALNIFATFNTLADSFHMFATLKAIFCTLTIKFGKSQALYAEPTWAYSSDYTIKSLKFIKIFRFIYNYNLIIRMFIMIFL